MAKLITDLKDNKTTSISPDILQNSINGFVVDEKNTIKTTERIVS